MRDSNDRIPGVRGIEVIDEQRAVEKKSLTRRLPPEVYIFLFYLAFTIFMTWPLIARFNTSIYGMTGDNLGIIWRWWWTRNAASFGGSATFCPIAGYPPGIHLNMLPVNPIMELSVRAMLTFLNEIVVFNLVIFSSFLLSGVTMYFLVRYLTGNRLAAFFGGFAYMSCPYIVSHALFVLDIALIQWMPLFVLALLVFLKKPSGKYALLLWGSAILVAWTSIHHGIFMAVFTAAFLLGHFVHRMLRARKSGTGMGSARLSEVINKKTLVLSLLVILGVLVLVMPYTYLITSTSFEENLPVRATPGEIRDLEKSYRGASRPWHYVLPEQRNFALGWITERIENKRSPWLQNTVYLGWVIIILAVYALIAVGRVTGKEKNRGGGGARDPDGPREEKSLEQPPAEGGDRGDGEDQPRREKGDGPIGDYTSGEKRDLVWGLAVAALAGFVFSLPPYLEIGSSRIYMPSAMFRLYTPMFRWYYRVGIVVVLCFTVLACLGIARMAKRLKRVAGIALLVLLVTLLFVETSIVPPLRNYDFSTIPEVFSRIAQLPAESSTIFYPAFEPGLFTSQEYLFYQKWYQKPTLNYSAMPPFAYTDAEAFRRTVYNPFNPDTPRVLSSLDIDYLVYMGDLFEMYEGTEETEEEISNLPEGLELVDTVEGEGFFSNVFIYGVSAPGA